MSLFHICFHLNVYPTGPLLHENLDVQDIPIRQIRDLSVNLCGKDVSCVTDNGNIAWNILGSVCNLKSM